MKHTVLVVTAFLAWFTFRTAAGQTVTAVTNGASFVAYETAPGSIATIFGIRLSIGTAQATTVPLPTTLAGTTVYVNGVAAPLYFVSLTQINFQIPNGSLQRVSTNASSVNVWVSGSNGGQFQFTVSTAAPGIFVDSNGRAIVQNQDYSVNTTSNPAAVGSYITAYLTGIGPVDNPVADGAVAPDSPLSRATLPFSATVGGVSANVVFLGLTPG
jgi:uncharacterized protein (TIGR03437 family)